MIDVISYIENSFLKDLINTESVTDISYNGKEIFYQDNKKGRLKFNSSIDEKSALDFIRQIANLSDSMFSYTNPILDISCGKYRINATHYAITRKNREKAINFAIRIGSDKLKILNDNEFIDKRCVSLIKEFLKYKQSIIISGVSGCGKTELQKFLLSLLEDNTRVIVIDNVDELETNLFDDKLDIQTWVLRNSDNLSYDDLIKNALRVNPDWLILSEARGEEMFSLLNGAMTGHPTISTIHSNRINDTYSRMSRMCLIKNKNLIYDETLADIMDHFKLIIHVKKTVTNNGLIKRYVDSIGTNDKGKFIYLFKYPNIFYELPKSIMEIFDISDKEFNKLKKQYETK